MSDIQSVHQPISLSLSSLAQSYVIVSLFIRCTMRCEIWAQPAELPWWLSGRANVVGSLSKK